jgi:TetR/AcrR family transcriptional regulator, regulator of mycofactocin system
MSESPRRERKKRETHDRLVGEAIRLFAERGYEATTTEDISDAADLAQRTFFRHFPSKEAVLYGDQGEAIDRIRAVFDARPADESTLDSLRAALVAHAASMVKDKQLWLLRAQLSSRVPEVESYTRAVVQVAWENAIAEGVARRLGAGSGDPRPAIVAGAALAAMRSAMRRWGSSNGRASLTRLLDESLNALGEIVHLEEPVAA